MIWLPLLKRFWPLIPLGIGLALLVFFSHKLETMTESRDNWQSKALEYQRSAKEWESSFRGSEKLRQDEAKASVGAVNASEQACETRIKAARDSAVKIEKFINKQPLECKPGESIPRVLADPAELLGAIGLRH